MLTLLLFDDHPATMSGIAHSLRTKNDIDILGQTSSLSAITALLEKQSVDVIISDMHLDGHNLGIDLLIYVKQYYPRTRFVFYTMIEKDTDVREAILAGADGYVLKRYDTDELYNAIQSVQRNRRYYSPELVQILVRTSTITQEKDEQPEVLRKLTKRELQIMTLIALDKSIAEIAGKLSLAESTVNSHRTNLMEKLGVRSNVGITHFAFKYKLIAADSM